ncbi:hypothetical protein CN188_31795, partial [Sinorhizobium meliloti]
TTAPPPAHYGAVKGALASGFATAELHHLWGHDRTKSRHNPIQHAEAAIRNCVRLGICTK